MTRYEKVLNDIIDLGEEVLFDIDVNVLEEIKYLISDHLETRMIIDDSEFE